MVVSAEYKGWRGKAEDNVWGGGGKSGVLRVTGRVWVAERGRRSSRCVVRGCKGWKQSFFQVLIHITDRI